MSNRATKAKDAYRLFYDDVVEGVRVELKKTLGSEKVPLQDVQRAISAMWKQSDRQEEYRTKARELRQGEETKGAVSLDALEEVEFPLHRIRRITALDEEGPRITKDTLRTLGKATQVFLSHIAARLHKHIEENDLSYPVKPEHIMHVINDPRYIMYQFLEHSQEHLIIQKDTNTNTVEAKEVSSVSVEEEPLDAQVDEKQPSDTVTEKSKTKSSFSILKYFGKDP